MEARRLFYEKCNKSDQVLAVKDEFITENCLIGVEYEKAGRTVTRD